MTKLSRREKACRQTALSTKEHTSTSWKSQPSKKSRRAQRAKNFFVNEAELREAFMSVKHSFKRTKSVQFLYTFSEKYQGIEKLLNKLSKDIKSHSQDPEHALLTKLAHKRLNEEPEEDKTAARFALNWNNEDSE